MDEGKLRMIERYKGIIEDHEKLDVSAIMKKSSLMLDTFQAISNLNVTFSEQRTSKLGKAINSLRRKFDKDARDDVPFLRLALKLIKDWREESERNSANKKNRNGDVNGEKEGKEKDRSRGRDRDRPRSKDKGKSRKEGFEKKNGTHTNHHTKQHNNHNNIDVDVDVVDCTNHNQNNHNYNNNNKKTSSRAKNNIKKTTQQLEPPSQSSPPKRGRNGKRQASPSPSPGKPGRPSRSPSKPEKKRKPPSSPTFNAKRRAVSDDLPTHQHSSEAASTVSHDETSVVREMHHTVEAEGRSRIEKSEFEHQPPGSSSSPEIQLEVVTEKEEEIEVQGQPAPPPQPMGFEIIEEEIPQETLQYLPNSVADCLFTYDPKLINKRPSNKPARPKIDMGGPPSQPYTPYHLGRKWQGVDGVLQTYGFTSWRQTYKTPFVEQVNPYTLLPRR